MQICLIPEVILYCEGVAFKFDRFLPPLDSKDKKRDQKSHMRKVLGWRQKFLSLYGAATLTKKKEKNGVEVYYKFTYDYYILWSPNVYDNGGSCDSPFLLLKWKFHFLVCLVSRGLLTRHMGFLAGKKKPPLGPGGPNIGIYDLFIHHGPKLNH